MAGWQERVRPASCTMRPRIRLVEMEHHHPHSKLRRPRSSNCWPRRRRSSRCSRPTRVVVLPRMGRPRGRPTRTSRPPILRCSRRRLNRWMPITGSAPLSPSLGSSTVRSFRRRCLQPSSSGGPPALGGPTTRQPFPPTIKCRGLSSARPFVVFTFLRA